MKLWKREIEEENASNGGTEEAVQRGSKVIREERLSLEEKLELERREMSPGHEYREGSWRRTRRESIHAIHDEIDKLRGVESPTSKDPSRSTRSVSREKPLPPGIRSRIRRALGPLAYVRLVYATKQHHICRAGLQEGSKVENVVVLVGPEQVHRAETVLEAIDQLAEDAPARSEDGGQVAEHTASVPSPPSVTGKDIFGDIHPVIDVEGIGETYSEKLVEIGIEDTEQLWRAQPDEVAEALDVSAKVVARWQAQVELMAINGIGPQYAELLARVGIGSIQALAEAEPATLSEQIHEKEDSLDVRIQGNKVTEKLTGRWIQAAKDHPVLEV